MKNLLLVFASFLCLTPATLCQTDANGPSGEYISKAYGSYDAQNFDSINLDNGRPVINIPIFSFPQRGEHIRVGAHLTYMPETLGRYSSTQPYAWGGMGIVPNFDYPIFEGDYGIFGAYYLQSSTGLHLLVPTVGRTTFMSPDGSGYQALGYNNGGFEPAPTATIIDREGNVYNGLNYVNGNQNVGITDIDGNQMSINISVGNPNSYLTGWTDTMGRQITYPMSYNESSLQYDWTESTDPATGEGIRTWTVPGISGGTATYTFKYDEQGYVDAPCILDGISGCATDTQGSDAGFMFYNQPALTGPGYGRITALQYPDGTSWKFAYDLATTGSTTAHYGDLIQVTTPLGATVSYQWATMPSFATVCAIWSGTPSMLPRTIVERTVSLNDGSSPQSWHYQLTPVNTGSGSISVPGLNPTGSSSYAAYAMVITDPAGNQIVHVFEPVDGICQYYETQTLVYQGSASASLLLNKIVTTYNHSNTAFNGGTVFDAVWKNSSIDYNTSTVYEQWANGPTSSEEGYAYEPIFTGLPAAVRTTDLISGTSIETDTTYAWQTDSGYLDAGLFSTPTSITQYSINPSTGVQTQIKYSATAYDESGSILSSGISTQHVTPTQSKRGLPTTVTSWRNTDNALIPSHLLWYDTGMLAQSIDSNGSLLANISYSSAYIGAYPTEVDDALGRATQKTYDFNTGLVLTAADANMLAAGTHITNSYYSSGTYQAGRLNTTTYPDGGTTTLSYPDAVTISSQATVDGTRVLTQHSTLDALGRTIRGQILNVPTSAACSTGSITQDITYDYAGRMLSETTPYCSTSDATYDQELMGYDALGRVTSYLWNNDGHNGSVFEYPSLNVAQEYKQDDSGGEWQRTYDGFGHLVQVLEESDQARQGDPPSVETDYAYDALGNLRRIDQLGDQQHSPVEATVSRTFVYDSLSQLVSSNNPESGVFTYTYDSHGNVQTFTDARNVTTLECYDILDRIVSVSTIDSSCSTNGPSQNPDTLFSYDVSGGAFSQSNLLGHASTVRSFVAGSETSLQAYGYDLMGRPKDLFEKLPSDEGPGTSHSTHISYDLLGAMTQLQYPSGRVINYSRDSLDRLSSIQDMTGGVQGATYLSGRSYYADSSVYQSTLGASISKTVSRDDLSRPLEVTATSSTLGTFLDSVFSYDADLLVGASNNLHPSPSYFKSYSYDALGRIYSFFANDSSGMKGLMYSYDPFGNLHQSNGVSGMPALPPDAVGPRNRLLNSSIGCSPSSLAISPDPQDLGYDTAGNLLCVGNYSQANDNQLIYNRRGQLASVQNHFTPVAAYTYSGEGNRVRKDLPAGAYTEYLAFGGNVLTERHADGSSTDYIYADGGKIAKIATTTGGTATLNYYLDDHLGTTQVELDAAGTVTWQGNYGPFGVELTQSLTSMNYKFTGKERDVESSLDYSTYRMYTSSTGRWTSPDPGWALAADPSSPQTLNMYAYVVNNPTSYRDGLGLSSDCGKGPDASVVCMVTTAWDYLTGNHSSSSSGSNSGSSGGETEEQEEETNSSFENVSFSDAGIEFSFPGQDLTPGQQSDHSWLGDPAKLGHIMDPDYKPNPKDKNSWFGVNHECVAACRSFTGLPPAVLWRMGKPILLKNRQVDASIPRYTAIAAFDSHGRFMSTGHENSALLIGAYTGYASRVGDATIVDQFKHDIYGNEHPAQTRVIRFLGRPQIDRVNNSNSYHVILYP